MAVLPGVPARVQVAAREKNPVRKNDTLGIGKIYFVKGDRLSLTDPYVNRHRLETLVT